MIFVDGVMVPDDCIDTVYGFISDKYLATIPDGDHELLVLNGDEFTVMTVTVTDHKMTAIKDKSLADYGEMDFTDYYDTVVAYFSAGADIIYCDLDEIVPLLGDVDGDGEVTIIDATFIQRWLASIPIPFELNKNIADTDGDGDVTIIDATCIQRYLASLNCPKGIEQPVSVVPV